MAKECRKGEIYIKRAAAPLKQYTIKVRSPFINLLHEDQLKILFFQYTTTETEGRSRRAKSASEGVGRGGVGELIVIV